MVRQVLCIFILLLLTTGSAFTQSSSAPHFLSLPFNDSTIKIQQGWLYAPSGAIHSPSGAFDYIKGSIDDSATWQSFDVLAAADGVACWEGVHDDPNNPSGYGNLVIVRHDQTNAQGKHYFTLYAHLLDGSVPSRIIRLGRHNTQYQQWTRVSAGDLLGRAGSTGQQACRNPAQCTHLHFEVRLDGYRGTPLDPYDVSRSGEGLFMRNKYPGGADFSGCGSNYLWATCPSGPGPSQEAGWLSFQEGNPGVPGDGIYVNAPGGSGSGGFILQTPFSLNGVTDGITVTVFFRSGAQSYRRFATNITNHRSLSEPCGTGIGSTFDIWTGKVRVNGVEGFFTNIPQSQIQAGIDFLNIVKPGCGLVVNDFFIDTAFFETTPQTFIETVDAVYIGKGQNNFPGARIR